jgi:hypothetical protein
MRFVSENQEKIKNLTWFAVLAALAIWQINLLNIALFEPIAQHRAVSYHTPQGTYVADFINFYSAGCIAASSDSHRAYDPAVQLDSVNKIIAPEHIDIAFYCPYTPLVYVLMIPFTRLPPETAFMVFVLLGLLCGTIGVLVLSRHLKWPLRQQLLLLFAILSSSVSVSAIALGQVVWWYVGILCFYVYTLLTNKDRLAGLSLAFLAIKPHYFIFFLIPALLFRRWRLLLWAAMTGLLMFVLVVHFLGWHAILSYPTEVYDFEINSTFSKGGQHPEGMIGIRALLARYFARALALKMSMMSTSFAALCSGGLWYLAARTKSLNSSLSYWAMSLSSGLCIIFSAHTNCYDALLLTIPAILTLKKGDDTNTTSTLWLNIWRLILITFPFTSWLFLYPPIYDHFMRLPFFALFVVLVVCGLLHFRRIAKLYGKQ